MRTRETHENKALRQELQYTRQPFLDIAASDMVVCAAAIDIAASGRTMQKSFTGFVPTNSGFESDNFA